MALCGNLGFMETHGIHPGAGRKEITCSDCGHVYLIGQGQSSGTCGACGNVAYLGDSGSRELTALSEEIVARRILPRLSGDPRSAVLAAGETPDGKTVEKIRIKYQVEWQLWAALVLNFGDSAFHMAYLSCALAEDNLERAAERYREHRSAMAILGDSRWQSEVADLMLARIEALTVSRLPARRGDYGFDIPMMLKLLPTDSRVIKVAWVAMGLFIVAKLLHLHSL